MNRVRKLALVVSTGAIALGAGHIVQNGQRGLAFREALEANKASKPTNVTPLAAGPDAAEVGEPEPDPLLRSGASGEAPGKGSPAEAVDCDVRIEMSAEPSATIGILLQSDCHRREPVVLRHAGLAVSARTNALGMLKTEIPALTDNAEVSILFADGRTYTGQVAIPDAPLYHRFAVQWMGDDAFQLHAFENGAGYGESGHVSAADPRHLASGRKDKGGYLTLLGDESVPVPLLAEVYTFPSVAMPVELVVEAAITDATCGRELIGETVQAIGEGVSRTDIFVSMPPCGTTGDILVLKNPVVPTKIAAVD